MFSEESFQQALEENIGDSSARLAFSDWLEEQGRTDEALVQRYLAKFPSLLKGIEQEYKKRKTSWDGQRTEEIAFKQLSQYVRPEFPLDAREAYAAWLRLNRRHRHAKTLIWTIRAWRGELGPEVFTVNQLQGKNIKGRAMKLAEMYLGHGIVAVVVSRKKPSVYGLEFRTGGNIRKDEIIYCLKGSKPNYVWAI